MYLCSVNTLKKWSKLNQTWYTSLLSIKVYDGCILMVGVKGGNTKIT